MSEPVLTPDQEARIRELIHQEIPATIFRKLFDDPNIVNNLLALENTIPRIPGILRRVADRLDAAERLKNTL